MKSSLLSKSNDFVDKQFFTTLNGNNCHDSFSNNMPQPVIGLYAKRKCLYKYDYSYSSWFKKKVLAWTIFRRQKNMISTWN